MMDTKRIVLAVSTALLVGGLAVSPASAEDAMKGTMHKTMKHKDGMMKGDAMKGGAMKGHMTKGDAMKGDATPKTKDAPAQ